MYKAIEEFIDENGKGLFLLDSPTGFGKTTAVLKTIKDFLAGGKFKEVKRMFFVTGLKSNLHEPYFTLLKQLTDEEKKQCMVAKSYRDSIIEKLNKVTITENGILNSSQYKKLKACVDTLNEIDDDIEKKKQTKGGRESCKLLYKTKESLIERVDSLEKQFRELVQKEFLFSKSVAEKKKFIKDNAWFRILYPISELEDHKVIFLTTKRFFSKVNVFYRAPFYIYADSVINNSVVFIDEFDATKKDVLNQIIEDGLSSQIDAIKLFKSIHYALQNSVFPQALTNVTEFNKEKVEAGEWDSPETIISKCKELFETKYSHYSFDHLLKSVEFEQKKAFLFDDGRYITVLKDNSKKYLVTSLDKQERYNKIRAERRNSDNNSLLNTLLRDVLYCVKFFAEGIRRLAMGYHIYKNTGKRGGEDVFNYDEAIKTIIHAFNIPEEFDDYLFKLIVHQKIEANLPDDVDCRKGFKFTVVQDSNTHDLQSLAHTFNYNTTPEDLIITLAKAATVVGISATASVDTVIGNYDLGYIKKILKDSYKLLSPEASKRIGHDFEKSQVLYKEKVKINVEIIDNLGVFSDKEKCQVLLAKIYSGECLNNYLLNIEQEQDYYYYLQTLKLVSIYKKMGKTSINSFIAFLNSFPTKNGDIRIDVLNQMFKDVAENNKFEYFEYSIIKSSGFSFEMEKVYEDLKQGKKHLVISTYQTIGSGKNIQYEIPESIRPNIVFDETSEDNRKDFDGIYLATPTHLMQQLSYASEKKLEDISRFLFQQEYLYLNQLISYGEMKYNIENGFKRLFFSDKYSIYYNKNKDIDLHTVQYVIQAVGRICRCRHKNKEIYIFSDLEILERLDKVKDNLSGRLFNAEFKALLNQRIDKNNAKLLENLTRINKSAYVKLSNMAKTVKASDYNVRRWKELREYVLKNPTTLSPHPDYKDLYFEFDGKRQNYSYSMSNYSLTNLKFDTTLNQQVSETACDLPMMLRVPYVTELFEKGKYAKSFVKNKFVMSESLFKQIYKGALGEVVGKVILERELGDDLEELNREHYEFFDFKYKNIYFDFKHWNEYVIDAERYIKKIKGKLNRVKGERCIVVNIVKRGDHKHKVSVDGSVIQIPYLIDDETGDIALDMIEKIEEAIIT